MVNNNQVGGWPTPLKNDGVRQWEGLYIPYIMEKMVQTSNQIYYYSNY